MTNVRVSVWSVFVNGSTEEPRDYHGDHGMVITCVHITNLTQSNLNSDRVIKNTSISLIKASAYTKWMEFRYSTLFSMIYRLYA